MIMTFDDKFSKIQSEIIEKYCNLESSKSCVISDDNWVRKEGGGGRKRAPRGENGQPARRAGGFAV